MSRKGSSSRHPKSLWRNRSYLLLWSGQAISDIGGAVSELAFPLLVLAVTHSPAQAGFVAAQRALPATLFSLFAGVLVDRWNRKWVMIDWRPDSTYRRLSHHLARMSLASHNHGGRNSAPVCASRTLTKNTKAELALE